MTEENRSAYSVGMQAEAGYEVDESAAPLRISGFLCLIFGLLSFAAILGKPLLVFPLIAFLFGMVASASSFADKFNRCPDFKIYFILIFFQLFQLI